MIPVKIREHKGHESRVELNAAGANIKFNSLVDVDEEVITDIEQG